MRFLKAVIGLALALVLAGCFTTSTSYLPPPAPLNLAFSENPAVYTKGVAIAPNVASHGGGAPIEYRVSPALPAGLALNAATGGVSGTPTALAATAGYTVTARNSGGSTSTVLTLTVNDVPPSGLTYASLTVQYTRGFSIVPNGPSSGGGPVTGYSVSPALPAGLSLNPTTGVISGTPSVVIPAAPYVVTASNSGGSTTITLTITVIDVAPSALGYTTNPAVYFKSLPITPNTPVYAGGPPVSYAVSPALPPGLVMDPATGILTGTPLAITPTAGYTVTATNTGGSTTATLVITVHDTPPIGLSYSTNPAVYTLGVPMTANVPTCGGGTVQSYGISPPLPTGMTLNSTTGIISGTPLALSPQTTYTVTATNTGGSTNTTLTLTVNDVPPSSLTYAANPAVYTKGTAITPNLPSHLGGTVISYAITPALPSGLFFNTATGVISGTPSVVAGTALYSVSATNSGGSTSVTLTITVNDVPPSALSYSASPAVYTKGLVIAPNLPTSSGGAVTSYTIAPALPAGLTLNPSTGVITGTPLVLFPVATFTITASNSGGVTQAFLNLTVNDQPPASLTYTTNPAVYTKGTPITPNTPSNGGGTVITYSVSPLLPSGLTIDPGTGIISGTPMTIQVGATYTVTATNTGGSTTASLLLTINDAPPANLAYSLNPAVYQKGASIAPNTPSSTGGAILSYAVSPSLPAGLNLNPGTGILSGTPTAITPATGYTVTATNSGGSASVLLTITVNDLPPANLAYSAPNVIYAKGVAISPNTPSSNGGAVTSYTVSPGLPSGLVLNPLTGVISGTPTVPSPTTTYTVTAANSGGSTTASITLQVKDTAPTNLIYTTNPVTYTKGIAITPNVPSNAGGTIVTYVVNPPLPVGLVLDTSTGIISGTPTVIVANQGCTVTGTNSGGSTSVLVTITVKDVPPSNLVYPLNPAVYTRGASIANNTPTYSGGTVTTWTVSPTLPGGLALNTSTGAIYGTPTVTTPAADYVVTATNTGGSTTATVNITVIDPPLAPPRVSLDTFVTSGQEGLLAHTEDQGEAIYRWTITGGTLTSGQGTPTATYTAGPAGNLKAEVRVTRQGRSVQGNGSAPIEPVPNADLALPEIVVPGSGTFEARVPTQPSASIRWTALPGTGQAKLLSGQGTERIALLTEGAKGTFRLEVNVQNRAGAHASGSRLVQVAPGCLIPREDSEAQTTEPSITSLVDGRLIALEESPDGLQISLFDPATRALTRYLLLGLRGENPTLNRSVEGDIRLSLTQDGQRRTWTFVPDIDPH